MSVCLVWPMLCNPVYCSPWSSSVHWLLQAIMLEWVAISSSRGSSQPRDQTQISFATCIDRQMLYHCGTFSSVQCSLSVMSNSATPWTRAHQASLFITNSRSILKLMSIKSVMPSSHLILSPAPNPSQHQGLFQWVNSSHEVAEVLDFSFSISPSNEHPGLISFRMDWLDLLAAQGTLKNLLQHHSSKASILQRSAFFTVQLSHPYLTTGKTIALTRCTFVGKVMSLLFNMLSSLVITFLSRSKRLLISWVQSPSAVILEPPQK